MINEKITVEAEKTIRESYTLPKKEQERLAKIQSRFSGIKPAIRKSEIVRVGIYNVEHLEEKDVKKILEQTLGRLSVGKPKKKVVLESNHGEAMTVNDKQWGAIATLFPSLEKSIGRPKVQYRQVLNGILYIFRYETQRRNVPKEYGSFATCRRDLLIWRKNKLWKQICNYLIKNAFREQKRDLESVLLRTWLIDTTHIS